jgi:hypothetical protein
MPVPDPIDKFFPTHPPSIHHCELVDFGTLAKYSWHNLFLQTSMHQKQPQNLIMFFPTK